MEDDYMSDDIILGVSNERVGIAKSRAHQRQLKIHARFEESRVIEKPKRQTQAEREKEKRDEALAKPISEESKGFALLAKMGFKPGMTLGKKRENDNDDETEHDQKRLKVPIGIDIKIGRKGLGHEAQETHQRNERVEMVMKKMKEQAEKHEELIDDYKKRRRMESTIKEVLKDIYTSRKVCEELDHREEKKLPNVPWFWRSYKVATDSEVPTTSKIEKSSNEDEYKYSNGLIAPPEIDFTSVEEHFLREKIFEITNFLRSHHNYCIWCGAKFDSLDDMDTHCPGDSRHSHDGEDD